MVKKVNPYEVLGVPDNAPFEDCKRAFKRLARKCHPDMPTGSDEAFIRIKDAYDMIEGGFVIESSKAPTEWYFTHEDLMSFKKEWK